MRQVYRVVSHPWVILAIMERAVQQFREDNNLALRRKAASFLRVTSQRFGHDDRVKIASPYAQISSRVRAEWTKRNAELLAADPDFGHLEEDHVEVVDGKPVTDPSTGRPKVVLGFHPVPDPEERATIDLLPGVKEFVQEKALEAFAKSRDVDNTLSLGIVDALEDLRSAKIVEIDDTVAALMSKGGVE